MFIDKTILEIHRACPEGIALFNATFPDGATYPDDLAAAHEAGLDTDWLMKEFKLTGWSATHFPGTNKIKVTKYFRDGYLHDTELGLPSVMAYDLDGFLVCSEYYNGGSLHRFENEGPAMLKYSKGKLVYKAWWINGEFIKEEWAKG